MLLQETKLDDSRVERVKISIWKEVGLAASEAIGMERGMMSLWNEDTTRGRVLNSSKWIVSIFCHHKISKENWILTNVYAPTSLSGLKELWRELASAKIAF